MLIRSQDNYLLVNTSELVKISIEKSYSYEKKEDAYSIEGVANCMSFALGKYTTEEKAIKVLDMLADNYGRVHASAIYLESVLSELRNELKRLGEVASSDIMKKVVDASIGLFAFQMPADEEVDGNMLV